MPDNTYFNLLNDRNRIEKHRQGLKRLVKYYKTDNAQLRRQARVRQGFHLWTFVSGMFLGGFCVIAGALSRAFF